jgi:hypothetical protein
MVNEDLEVATLRRRVRVLTAALDDALRGLERASGMTVRQRQDLLADLRARRAAVETTARAVAA